ncbi:MAG: ferredoxin [Methanoregula sp.]
MQVIIDRSLCVSCGACWNICPDVFWQNPCDGFSEIAEEFRFGNDRAEGFIQEDLMACAREAAHLCPVEIIAVRDE